jgi:hypothetical protein
VSRAENPPELETGHVRLVDLSQSVPGQQVFKQVERFLLVLLLRGGGVNEQITGRLKSTQIVRCDTNNDNTIGHSEIKRYSSFYSLKIYLEDRYF